MNWMGPGQECWIGGFWVFPLFMALVMLVCVFVCARIFLAGVGRSPCRDRRQQDGHDDSPLEIAKRRYANGEISQEEFGEIKNTIV